jgi:hypothetical protein
MEEYREDVLASIPAYNEAVGIAAVVAAARQYLPVLVVDDGSLDDTASLAESAGAQVLHQLPNQGKGAIIPDNQSGYRLLSGRLMQALLESTEQGFEYEVEMIAICVRRGYNLFWVPIRTISARSITSVTIYAYCGKTGGGDLPKCKRIPRRRSLSSRWAYSLLKCGTLIVRTPLLL